MLFKLVFLSLGVLSCTAAPSVRFYGNILGKALRRYRYIGCERVMRNPNAFGENKVVFDFPKCREEDSKYVIKYIQQIDLAKKRPAVNFIDGGIGAKSATIQVKQADGAEVDTTFEFYGRELAQNGKQPGALWKKLLDRVRNEENGPGTLATFKGTQDSNMGSENIPKPN